MRVPFILTLFILNGSPLLADVYLGELAKGTCRKLAGQTFAKYRTSVLADKKYEVTTDEESGHCGKAIYVMKKEGRKRWAVFPDEKGCLCYQSFSNEISKGKEGGK